MDHFKEAGNFFRMGRPPIQIDVITEADGIAINVISKEDLIRNKKASGRLRDLADAEALEEI